LWSWILCYPQYPRKHLTLYNKRKIWQISVHCYRIDYNTKSLNFKEQPPRFSWQKVWGGYVTRWVKKGSQRAWKSLVRSSRKPTSLDDFESKQLARDNKSPAKRLKRTVVGSEFKGSCSGRYGGPEDLSKGHTPRRCMSMDIHIVRSAKSSFLWRATLIRHERIVLLKDEFIKWLTFTIFISKLV